MTPAQRHVYNAIIVLTERNGIPPSTREICEEAQLSSTSTVHSHLSALRRLNYITYRTGQPRTIRVLACALPGAA
jgi:repressor LexA